MNNKLKLFNELQNQYIKQQMNPSLIVTYSAEDRGCWYDLSDEIINPPEKTSTSRPIRPTDSSRFYSPPMFRTFMDKYRAGIFDWPLWDIINKAPTASTTTLRNNIADRTYTSIENENIKLSKIISPTFLNFKSNHTYSILNSTFTKMITLKTPNNIITTNDNQEIINWALQFAIDNDFDVFGFQKGERVFFANMGKINESFIYKPDYTKLGPYLNPTIKSCGILGDINSTSVNRVYIKKMTFSEPVNRTDFKDMGFWKDYYNQNNINDNNFRKTISPYFIDINNTGRQSIYNSDMSALITLIVKPGLSSSSPLTELINWASTIANTNGFDTIGYQKNKIYFGKRYTAYNGHIYDYTQLGQELNSDNINNDNINHVFYKYNKLIIDPALVPALTISSSSTTQNFTNTEYFQKDGNIRKHQNKIIYLVLLIAFIILLFIIYK